MTVSMASVESYEDPYDVADRPGESGLLEQLFKRLLSLVVGTGDDSCLALSNADMLISIILLLVKVTLK